MHHRCDAMLRIAFVLNGMELLKYRGGGSCIFLFRNHNLSANLLRFLRDPRNVIRDPSVDARKSWSAAAYTIRHHAHNHQGLGRTTSDHQGSTAISLQNKMQDV